MRLIGRMREESVGVDVGGWKNAYAGGKPSSVNGFMKPDRGSEIVRLKVFRPSYRKSDRDR